MTRRALKIGFGIAFLIVGLFTTIFGVALLALVGADGRFELPETTARSSGYALVFDAIYVRGNLPTSGSLSTTLGIEVHADAGGREVFVGVAPSSRLQRYLSGVPYDRVVRIDWPGGADTEAVEGTGEPVGPPGVQTWWEASDQGASASVSWTVQEGDWSVVVMNADGAADVDVVGRVEVELPVLGPVSVGMLIAGVALLLLGVLVTVSGAKIAKTARPDREAEAAVATPSSPPARPDA